MNEATSRVKEELDIDCTCAFLRDLASHNLQAPNFGGTSWGTSWGMYNLVVSTGALKIFIDSGMKPNAQWNLKVLKQYFGITGCKNALLDQLILIQDIIYAEA